MARTQLQRIGFTNHLMFNAVLTENEDLCRRIIQAVLGKHVESIEYLDDERTIQPELDGHGARLDLLALVDGEYVDIEMQVGKEPSIARRCRFYHGAIATRHTPKGKGYGSVPKSYVIFICMNDPLGAGHPRYVLETTCLNDPSVHVDDGATTILLNAGAWSREEEPDVAGMLEYVSTGSSESGLAKDIAEAVNAKNDDRKWVRASMGVMTYEHELIVLNDAIAKKEAELEAATAQAEAATAQAEAATAQAEAATAQAEAATAQAEAATAQAEAARAETQAIKQLFKRLSAEGRLDEYAAALDDPSLMETLLAELAG